MSETEPLSGVQGDGAGDLWPWVPWAMKASSTTQGWETSSLPEVSSGSQPGEGTWFP